MSQSSSGSSIENRPYHTNPIPRPPHAAPQNHSTLVWKIVAVVSAIFLILAIAGAITLYCYFGSNYLMYGAAIAGILSIVALVISLRKVCQAPSSIPPYVDRNKVSKSGITVTHRDHLQAGTNLREYTAHIPQFDKADFERWLFAHHPTNNKTEVLNQTVMKSLEMIEDGAPLTISYDQMSQTPAEFEAVLDRPFGKSRVQTESTAEWYQYKDGGHTHIVFAAKHIGGGFRDKGMVQEEIMFMEHFKLILVTYITERAGQPYHPDTQGDPTPYVVVNVHREHYIDDGIYSSAPLEQTKRSKVKNHIHKPPQDSQPVTIAGIAARRWDNSSTNRYSREDLNYAFKAAYLAFMAEKLLNQKPVVYTGAWGCGAFNNSDLTMVTIQLLAARAAGVDLVFTGVGDERDPSSTHYKHPNYTYQNITKLRKWANQQMTPKAALKKILDMQEETPKRWAPSQHAKPPEGQNNPSHLKSNQRKRKKGKEKVPF